MKAKEYFARVKELFSRARTLKAIIEYGLPSGGGGTCSGAINDVTAKNAEAVISAKCELKAITCELEAARNIVRGIEAIFSGRARVIELKYLEGESWDQVSSKLNISRSTAHRWQQDIFDFCDQVGFACMLDIGMRVHK